MNKEDKLYNIYMDLISKISNKELNKLGYALIEYVRNDEIEPRTCNECGKEMWEGYCVDNGMEYYCCADCLDKNYTDEEWQDLYATGDSYYTNWFEEKELYYKGKEVEE